MVERVELRRRGRHWTLRVAGRGDIELELWAAQRNMRPLEEELGAPVKLAAWRAAAQERHAILDTGRRSAS